MYKKSANKNEAISIANDISDVANDTVAELMTSLEKAANKAGKKVRIAFGNASDEATMATKLVQKQIKSKPLQSAAIALGAGLLLGALFRR